VEGVTVVVPGLACGAGFAVFASQSTEKGLDLLGGDLVRPRVVPLAEKLLNDAFDGKAGPIPDSVALAIVEIEFDGITKADSEFGRAVVLEEELDGLGKGVGGPKAIEGLNGLVELLIGKGTKHQTLLPTLVLHLDPLEGGKAFGLGKLLELLPLPLAIFVPPLDEVGGVTFGIDMRFNRNLGCCVPCCRRPTHAANVSGVSDQERARPPLQTSWSRLEFG
jgi:hypothetical protein